MFCREQVAQLRDITLEITALGARLAAVGSGNARQAKAFAAERELSFELFADPGLRAFRAAELRRGVASSLSPRLVGSALRALGGGHLQGVTRGDPWQHGGSFVVGRGGAPLAFAQVSAQAGDHPDPSELVAAVRSLSQA